MGGGSKMQREAFESMGKGATSPRAERAVDRAPPVTEKGPPSMGQPCGLGTLVTTAEGHLHTQTEDEALTVLCEPAFHTNAGPPWSPEKPLEAWSGGLEDRPQHACHMRVTRVRPGLGE